MWLRRALPTFGVAVMLLPGIAIAQQIAVETVKPEPAWCGGSYSLTGGLNAEAYWAAVDGGQPVPAGNNFGDCVPIVREVRGVDGKASVVTIPTYPQYPYSQLVERDGKLFHDTGELDKDGKPVLVELTYPDRPKQDRK